MGSWPLLVAVIASISAAAPAAEKNADLERAQKNFEELKYAEAGKALEAAWAVPGNDREMVLKILELQAVVAAAVGQQDRARSLFRTLLYLSPEFVLPEGDLGPKVMSLYYEAKGRQSVDGWLRFEPGPPPRPATKVTDTQLLGKSVRFHSRAPGQPWTLTVVPLRDSQAALPVEAPAEEWWAELLGENDRVLARMGTEAVPILAAKLAPPLPPKKPGPAPFVGKPSGPTLRPLAWAGVGVGALAATGGIVFGVQANGQKNQIVGATRDAEGRVDGITRAKALSINEQLRGSATVANTLFVVSAALVATGVVLFVVSRDVELGAAPGGVTVKASLP